METEGGEGEVKCVHYAVGCRHAVRCSRLHRRVSNDVVSSVMSCCFLSSSWNLLLIEDLTDAGTEA